MDDDPQVTITDKDGSTVTYWKSPDGDLLVSSSAHTNKFPRREVQELKHWLNQEFPLNW